MTGTAPTDSPRSQPAIDVDVFCEGCGYNLRGLTRARCPECGSPFEDHRGRAPQIPWMYRTRIGWFRAYWKTVLFVMFRQKRFANEMARPVSYPASQRFRWTTVALAMLAALILTNFPFIYFWFVPPPWPPLPVHVKLVIPITALASAFLTLAGMTGVASYLFHPQGVPVRQQNRAVALSYYACGPLALLPIPAACLAAGIAYTPRDSFGDLLILIGATTPFGLVAIWWFDLIHLALRLLPQRPGRAVAVALLVPIMWAGVALIGLGVVPALIASLVLIPRTLH